MRSESSVSVLSRISALLIAVLMVIGIFPMAVFAETGCSAVSDIAAKSFSAGRATEFSITVTANDDAGISSYWQFAFGDAGAVEKFEYRDESGVWKNVAAPYVVANNFILKNETHMFRVTFNKSGTNSIAASLLSAEDDYRLFDCAAESVSVGAPAAAISTDFGGKYFVAGDYTEFNATVAANGDAGKNVSWSFEWNDLDMRGAIEVKDEKGIWQDAATLGGFDLKDGSYAFRAKFTKAGTSSVKFVLTSSEDGSVISGTEEIAFNVLKSFDLTVNRSEGGKISVDDVVQENGYNGKYPENTMVKLTPAADEGYILSSVTVNGTRQEPDKDGNISIMMTADITVSVEFAQVYTFSVRCSENGKIESTPYCDGGSVQVEKGSTITVTATPNANYRVSEVKINGVVDETIKGENDEAYFIEIKDVNKKYDIEVSFSLNRYKVAFNEAENGIIEVSAELVEYGGNCDVVLVPDEGYTVASVKVNDVAPVINDSDGYKFSISGITADQNIAVEFMPVSPAEVSSVIFNSADAVNSNLGENTYVFAKNAQVKFKGANNAPVRITVSDGTVLGGPEALEIVLTQTTLISKIELLYKGQNDICKAWHPVKSEDKFTSFNIILDNISAVAELVPEGANEYGIFNCGFDVNVTVNDSAYTAEDGTEFINSFSGIAKVEFQVTDDIDKTNVTQEGVIFEREAGVGVKESLTGKITVEVTDVKNNSDYVAVQVKVTDTAGNESVFDTGYIIVNTFKPVVSVSIDGESAANAEDGYYNSERKAVISIIDRGSCFDSEAATNAIKITATDLNGDPVDNAYYIDNWTSENDNHSATVTFCGNAYYEYEIGYTDKAGLTNDGIKEITGENANGFTVDCSAPDVKSDDGSHIWKKLFDVLTFGTWKRSGELKYVAIASDTVSPCREVLYYESNLTRALKADELEEAYKNGEFTNEPYTISENGLYAIYARLEDYAGNVRYVGTDGIVYDINGAKITFDPSFSRGKVYSEDVPVNFTVNDSENLSGIKKIEYYVTRDGVETQRDTVFSFEYQPGENPDSNNGLLKITDWDSAKQCKTPTVTYEGPVPEYKDLVHSWNGTVIVDKRYNNSSAVVLHVEATDNTGAVRTAELKMRINTNHPSVTVEFEDEGTVKDSSGYYNGARTATITIIEREDSFESAKASEALVISAVDADGEKVEDAYTVGSEWITEIVEEKDIEEEGAEAAPETEGDVIVSVKHTNTVKFNADARYNFSVSYTNKAGVSNENVYVIENGNPYVLDSTVGNFDFTIDRQKPTGSVSLEDNVWKELLNVITFGIFSDDSVDLTIEASDELSPVEISYYISNEKTAVSASTLDALDANKWTKYGGTVTIPKTPGTYCVYAKIADKAGNYIYVSSDGIVIDVDGCDIKITSDIPEYVNKDLDIEFSVENKMSGIKTIEYWVEYGEGENKAKTPTRNLFTYEPAQEAETVGYDDLQLSWQGNLTVYAKEANSSSAMLYIKAVTNADVATEETVPLDIDTTLPVINITYDNNKDNNGNGYFNALRTATVVITERPNHFDEDEATRSISSGIRATDINGSFISDSYVVSDWITGDEEDPDSITHTATIQFMKDANYQLELSYTDKAVISNDGINTADQAAPFDFTIDRGKPYGSLTAVRTEGDDRSWTASDDPSKPTYGCNLVSELTFGYISTKGISVYAASADDTSRIESVKYYMPVANNATDLSTAMSYDDLVSLPEASWRTVSGAAVNDRGQLVTYVDNNKQFAVYVKITDMAGNICLLGTDGLLVDNRHPETAAPQISVTTDPPVNGIYKGNVGINISVEDPLVGGTYSGLKEVRCAIYDKDSATPDTPTQEKVLFTFDKENPQQSDLVQKCSGYVIVDSVRNNSNNVQVVVYAVDNAGNKVDTADVSSPAYTSLKIDVTAPVIDVSYDNNNADSTAYFKENRNLTISIKERNFKAEDVRITISNDEGPVPVVSGWRDGGGSGDNAVHYATVSFTEDGLYHFFVNYTDLAGNRDRGTNYAPGTIAGEFFTIDKTIPTINVSYNNNNAVNGNYYKDARTATVTVNERNFGTDRLNITLTATDDGRAITVPTVGGWSDSGNTHTATINYPGDGLYTFDISFTDMAGNVAADYAADTFYIDKTAPTLKITGVKDKSANNGEVIPVIEYSDTNLDKSGVQITLTGANNGKVDLKKTTTAIHNGEIIRFENIAEEKKNDDIYTLTAVLKDKAGNTTTQTITYSVNRFGSVYELDEYSKGVNGTYVTQLDGDIQITETNANELSNVTLTLFKNNTTIDLVEGEDYTISVVGGNGEWYQYTYTVFKKNFDNDAAYQLSIHSEDAAGNVSENTLDTKELGISFGVDKTPPTINIKNIESNMTYAEETLAAQISADDNLKLDSVVVFLDGKEYKSWSGEELQSIIANGTGFEFDISGDSTEAHNLKIVATDAAGNEYSEEVNNFYVTTNMWVRYYTNTPLLIGSAAGAAAVAGGIVALIALKKKKKANASK